MSDREYWVHIGEEDRHLGAGFLLTREYVLTALHCLRRRSSDDARLVLELADGRRVHGWLCDAAEDVDLALIAVEEAHSHRLPLASPTDRPRPGVAWRGAYAPPGENTQLSGRITHVPYRYRSRAGGAFTGVQLTVEQELGDYSGYSGSPVDTDTGRPGEPEPEERPVVGILMEQQLSREDHVSGTNVLVAASVLHAFEVFSAFHMERLKELTSPPGRQELVPRPRRSEEREEAAQSLVSNADLYLRRIREWEESAVIPRAVADEERRSALRMLRERLLGDGGGGA
ncbi:trypsin-like peptidase domain-containing protein [Streptomyces coeruleorubidus]|uniref:trypsin-like peptidase domain-containing protein n=1 Tax=Streptomyces coeruleorubidus TaxID=116188 RepID=UPI0033AAA9DF